MKKFVESVWKFAGWLALSACLFVPVTAFVVLFAALAAVCFAMIGVALVAVWGFAPFVCAHEAIYGAYKKPLGVRADNFVKGVREVMH